MPIRPMLTEPQRRCLQSAIDHGSVTAHLKEPLEWAGWGGTREALKRRGWIDDSCQITDAGRAVVMKGAV